MQGLAKIEGVVAKASAQIDGLLDVARLQAGQPLELHTSPIDLVALTQHVSALYQPASGRHHIRVDTELPQPVCRWDATRLERVLGNLLSNAMKYSPQGGQITVEVAREEGAGDTWAVLVVRDQGIGIPESELPNIFERFYRASNARGRVSGTGLGLAGVRQIVEQHGGSVSVAGEEGCGSAFAVRLPVTWPQGREPLPAAVLR